MSAATSELSARLRLLRSAGIGPITFQALIARYRTAGRALESLPQLARSGARSAPVIASIEDVETEMRAVERAGARYICWDEENYPATLATVEGAPPILCTHGRSDLLKREMVAIVGARNASAAGRRIAEQLAAELGAAGFVVTSGLARGIDGAAHRGSLSTGTCAVVAGGVDVVYPPEHKTLHEEIATNGIVISEMPIGLQPTAQHFPRRNRLISGLARGVIVVEAAQGSGSLITARYALEQNREIFAVPGSPLDPRSRGSNDLIRQGATLTETVDDVVRVLQPMLRQLTPRDEAPAPLPEGNDDALPDARRCLIELLGPTPVEVDELIRQSAIPASVVMTVLLELELTGRLARHPGHRVSLT